MTRIALPARADRVAAETVLAELRTGIPAGDVTIDGSDVTQLGQAMLQVLIAGRRQAVLAGNEFTIVASDAMRTILAMADAEAVIDGGHL
ncbi:MAG: STAS domain-containing protein [Sphingomonas sp.]|jgi:anti-anti-sigma regulatory factor